MLKMIDHHFSVNKMVAESNLPISQSPNLPLSYSPNGPCPPFEYPVCPSFAQAPHHTFIDALSKFPKFSIEIGSIEEGFHSPF